MFHIKVLDRQLTTLTEDKAYKLAIEKAIKIVKEGGGRMEKQMRLDKKILSDYIDACELIKETEEDIRRLEKHETVHDKVSGSNPEFPYQKMSFPISGEKVIRLDSSKMDKERMLLQQRKETARQIKIKVDEMMNSVPIRIQRIIKYKFFEGLSWGAVAERMGRNATADSIRMELNNFFKEK